MAKRNPQAQKIIERMRYIKKLDKKPYESKVTVNGVTYYWGHGPASVASRYSADIVEKNMAAAFAKMVFFRTTDEKGVRLFTHQDEMDSILNDWDNAWITEIGSAILAWDYEYSDLEKLKEDAEKN